MDDDLSMLERWRSGDAAAGRDLFRRHFAELYRFFASKAAGPRARGAAVRSDDRALRSAGLARRGGGRDEFATAFEQLGGNVRALARHFRRERRQIYRWIQAHGMRGPR